MEVGIVGRRFERVQLPFDHAAAGSVERDPVSFFEHLTLHPHLPGALINLNVARARHAAFPHSARDHSRVTGHAAARSQNASGNFHALNVFGSGFGAHQNYRILLRKVSRLLHRFLRSENNLPDCCTRRRRQTYGEHFHFCALFVEARNQEIVELIRFHPEDCIFLSDQSFFDHLNRDPHRGPTGTLAVACLQHVELAILDGELEILHVFVVLLEARRDVAQLVVYIGHDLVKFGNVNWSTNAGNHILTLRIHEKFAVELFRAGGGISREAHARAAGVAQIAVHHGLHVDRSAEHVIDVVDAAVVLGALVLPGAEHRVPRHYQLLVGILREVALGVLLDDFLILLNSVSSLAFLCFFFASNTSSNADFGISSTTLPNIWISRR